MSGKLFFSIVLLIIIGSIVMSLTKYAMKKYVYRCDEKAPSYMTQK